jgi:hydrogenase nickel incorporation protein HypB
MCGTCGCEQETRLVQVERRVLGRNDDLARRNRAWLDERGIRAVNVMSSPGSGKTTLLERTVRDRGGAVAVIEGDQATDHDAERIRRAGARAVQVNTGTGCHLDAAMVARALEQLAPARGSVVLIENVGNLVCPALFDLGEHARVVVASVTEGDDKPVKYPHAFRGAHVVVLNKIDLLPHVSFDLARFEAFVRAVHPTASILPVSATRGDGLPAWEAWLGVNSPVLRSF